MFYFPVHVKFASPQGFWLNKSKSEISGENIWADRPQAPEVTRTTQRQMCFSFRQRPELSPGGKLAPCSRRAAAEVTCRTKSWITPSHQSVPVRTTFHRQEIHLKKNGNVPCYCFVTDIDREAIKPELYLGLASYERQAEYKWVKVRGCVSQ